MKILIIKFRNIGDVLLATPLVDNLKLNYPHSQIDFALNRNCQEIILGNPNINQVFSYNRSLVQSQNIFLKIYYEFTFFKTILKNKYDIVINLTEGDRGTLIAFFSKSKLKLGFKPRKGLLKYLKIYHLLGDDKTKMHTVDKDTQFITMLNKKIFRKKVAIYWQKEDEIKINKFLSQKGISAFIHIHPVARWMYKCWSDEKMAQIIDYLEIEKKTKVIVTSSNDEKEKRKVRKILSMCKSSPENLVALLTLKELAYLSSKAKFFLGVDSAPMHIAASTTSVIALFGGSEVEVWGPWDNQQLHNPYKNCDGIQQANHNMVISNTNHEIFFIDGEKRTKGMEAIAISEVKKCIDIKFCL